MMNFKALALMGLLLCSPLWAQSQDTTENPNKTLPTVEEDLKVWGTEVKTSSIKLSGETMAIKQPDHLSDLLRTVPGVDVGGAHSLNQRITMRSLGDRDIKIDIDGAAQNSFMYHHMGNLQIHADILKSVDLEVGSNSVVNGGLGGSVHFQTKDAADLLEPGKQFGARLQGGYGDNARRGYSATGFGRLGEDFDFLAYYNFVDRDNYSVGGNRILDAQGNQVPGTDGSVRGLEGELGDALFKLGWNLSGTQRLEVGVESYQDEGDYSYRPDMGLATDLAIAENLGLPLVYPTQFTRDTLTLNYEVSLGGHTRLEATAFSNDSELQRDESGVAAVFGGAAMIRGEARNQGVKLTARSTFDRLAEHTLTYGLTYTDYDTDYSDDIGQAASESSGMTGLFLEDRIAWDNGFAVTPGVRYDHAAVDSKITDDSYSGLSAGLALDHRLNDHFSWRLSGTQVFKAPEISEVFLGAGLRSIQNPNINEETGLNTELGFDYNYTTAGHGRLTLGSTLFRTQIDDYIYDYAPNPTGGSWNDNVGDMRVHGWEAYVGYGIGAFAALLTHESAESELSAFSEYVGLEGVRLDRTQGDTFSLALDYQWSDTGLKLHWDVLDVSGLSGDPSLDGASLNTAKDPYTVHNVSARWQPDRLRGLSLTVGVDNLFDEFYASHSSRTGVSRHPRFGELFLLDYEPGRNFKATAAFSF